MNLADTLKTIAKSIAAFVAVMISAFLADRLGAEIDTVSIETVIVALFNALIVWLVPNKPPVEG